MVSIHAPARGATESGAFVGLFADVSIHAPARGATGFVLASASCLAVSIHAPARGATKNAGRRERAIEVSIHAPARGATSVSGKEIEGEHGFNPRAREGRDCVKSQSHLTRSKFQSTRPRGARRISIMFFPPPPKSFNPRAREGRDAEHVERRMRFVVSIHAPARGATLQTKSLLTVKLVSIHAPARGATPAARASAPAVLVSIHAPARGATTSMSIRVVSCAFQSTRPRGARRVS